MSLANWFETNLRCPVDQSTLAFHGKCLISEKGAEYPVIDGIPVLLRPDVEQTIELASASLARSRGVDLAADDRFRELHLESLGISGEEKESLVKLYQSGPQDIDPVVSYLVGATSGYLYKDQIGKLESYPIPDLRLEGPDSAEENFLDIGCSWGRWSIAAAGKGYSVVGVDPSLGALLAARRVSSKLGLDICLVCADARFLPFRSGLFNVVFSYSVLQHFKKAHVRECLLQIQRVIKSGGESLIQMPNVYGLRCLQHQIRRGFRPAKAFEVRYWKPGEMLSEFGSCLGQSELSVDCYFGLGLQASDLYLMSRSKRVLIQVSEYLRSVSVRINWMRYLADSIYVRSTFP